MYNLECCNLSEAFLVPRSFSDLSFLPTVACSSFFSVLDEHQEQSRADSGRKKNDMREKGTRSKKSNLIFLVKISLVPVGVSDRY